MQLNSDGKLLNHPAAETELLAEDRSQDQQARSEEQKAYGLWGNKYRVIKRYAACCVSHTAEVNISGTSWQSRRLGRLVESFRFVAATEQLEAELYMLRHYL